MFNTCSTNANKIKENKRKEIILYGDSEMFLFA